MRNVGNAREDGVPGHSPLQLTALPDKAHEVSLVSHCEEVAHAVMESEVS